MTRFSRSIRMLPLIALVAGALVTLTPGTALGAVIRVTTPTDETSGNGECSLREAIMSANSDGASVADCVNGFGSDLIVVPSGRYRLTMNGANELGDLDLAGTATIRGAGARRTTIARGPGFVDRIFEMTNGGNVLEDLKISGGIGGTDGGGIFIQAGGILQGRRLNITGNRAEYGGGISSISGTLFLSDSVVAGNLGENSGGGMYLAGTVRLTNVTVHGNRANNGAGGIFMNSSNAVVRHTTIAGNRADDDNSGGGAYGGMLIQGGGLTLQGSIVSGNTVGSTGTDPSCGGSGTGTSGGFNIVQGGCPGITAPSDSTASAQLRGFANNGGPTDTRAIRPTSPARNRATSGCPARDQRGAPRRNRCDSGSYQHVQCAGIVVNRVGTAAGELLIGTSGRDGILGLGGRDILRGLGGGDGLCGGDGSDRLVGSGGADRLRGGPGGDLLIGGSGDDDLDGGNGNDVCRGGGGANVFIRCEG